MALTATIYMFAIDLADNDRGVYESLELRVARHPSESEEYLVARVIAYCLELTEGIAFSKGVSSPEEPAITVRDLTGALRAWIEIGAPDADRLHKACKSSPRVAVYTHRDSAQWLRSLEGERIHRGGELEIYAIDRLLISELCKRLDRRMAMTMSITDRELYIAVGDSAVTGAVSRVR